MNNKLHLRVSRIVTLGAIIFALIASAISYSHTQSVEQAAMKKALEQLFSTVQRSAEIAAYLESRDLAWEVVESLSRNDIISGSTLTSKGGMTVASDEQSDYDEVFRFPLYGPFTPTEQVGEVQIQLNESLLNARVQKSAFEQMLILVIQILVIAILILIMVLRVLTYPIQSIAASLHRIVPGDDNNLDCPKGHKNNEIGNLVDDINKLLDSTRATIKQEQYLRNRVESLEKHFRLIFERASAGIFLLDEGFRLNSINQAFKDIAGIALEERRSGKQNIYLPDLFYEPAAVRNILQEVLAAGKQTACDLRLGNLINGEERWVHCLFSTVRSDEGNNLIEGLIVDVTERTFQMERILFEAQHDVLTQLFNRRAGEQLFNIMLANARNNQGQLAVLLVDLDDFKLINDTHGHEAGDKVLVEIARRMQLTVRKEDILVRMGGDEFIITYLIKDGNRDEIDQVVNKLQKQFTAKIDVGSDRSVTIGASIGVALFPQDGEDIETLIAHADINMYQIKKDRKMAHPYLLSTQSTE